MKKSGVFAIAIMVSMLPGYLTGTANQETMQSQQKPPRIAIFGAGLAGLSAAWHFQKSGFENVILYEARQRVGGKVLTCTFVDAQGQQHYTELGAENILDAGDAPYIRSLIQEIGLELFNPSHPEITVKYYNGMTIVDPYTKMIAYGFTPDSLLHQMQTLASCAENLDEVLQKLFPNDDDLRNYFSLRLACFEGGFAAQLSAWSNNFQSLYKLVLDKMFNNGTDIYDREFRDCLCIKGGNSNLTECLGQKLSGSIKLGHQLKHIVREGNGTYTMTFANGVTSSADIIIFAIPCTVYNDIEIATNVIPEQTAQIIKDVRYGQDAKISFPITQKISDVFCNNYAVLYQPKQGGVLTLFYCGERSYFTSDTIGSTFAQDIPFIRATTNMDFYIAQPVVCQDKVMQTYVGPVGHSWTQDPFAKGSYSHIAPGQEAVLTPITQCAGEQVRTVFAPLNNNTVFFAGEHTTVFLDTFGTMEAAVESGVRTAKIITKLYGQGLW